MVGRREEVLADPIAAAQAVMMPELHTIAGSGYQRLDDDMLVVQLDGTHSP